MALPELTEQEQEVVEYFRSSEDHARIWADQARFMYVTGYCGVTRWEPRSLCAQKEAERRLRTVFTSEFQMPPFYTAARNIVQNWLFSAMAEIRWDLVLFTLIGEKPSDRSI